MTNGVGYCNITLIMLKVTYTYNIAEHIMNLISNKSLITGYIIGVFCYNFKSQTNILAPY